MTVANAAAALLVVSSAVWAQAPAPAPCTGSHGNQLKCGSEIIYALTANESDRRDGTYSTVDWKEYQGDDAHWRETSISQSGHIYTVLERGAGNVSQWLVLGNWVFPRKQRLRVAKYPGQMKFDVVDGSGMTWTLSGTPLSQVQASFSLERIGDAKQVPVPAGTSVRSVVGMDLGAAKPFWLEHKGASLSPQGDQRAPAYLKAKSIFHDRRGRTCAVPNGELFGPRPDLPHRETPFLFETDEELLVFLTKRCPKLDLEPLRYEKVVEPPPRQFNKQAQ